ncbi:hypothetical protein D3C86_720450 [compost metagenome]
MNASDTIFFSVSTLRDKETSSRIKAATNTINRNNRNTIKKLPNVFRCPLISPEVTAPVMLLINRFEYSAENIVTKYMNMDKSRLAIIFLVDDFMEEMKNCHLFLNLTLGTFIEFSNCPASNKMFENLSNSSSSEYVFLPSSGSTT